MMGFLYKITSPSGKSYIGITTGSVERRWQHHQSHTVCAALAAAIAKYGAKNMSVATMAEVEDDMLPELERKAIVAFGTKVPNGYNLTDGGDGTPGRKMSEETKQKLRELALGRKHSAESNFKKGSGWRDKKRPEHAAALTGRTRPDHAQFMRDLWAQRKQAE